MQRRLFIKKWRIITIQLKCRNISIKKVFKLIFGKHYVNDFENSLFIFFVLLLNESI